ncbi:alkaline phosphatase family protein [Thalassotalea montiporae]
MKFLTTIMLVLSVITVTPAFAEKAPTVLLSIDGFSQEQFELLAPKHLSSLRDKGFSSNALLPVYPTKTFPNHISIVTGKYPLEHGIIHNRFYSRKRNNLYSMGKTKEDPSWLLAKPLWVLAEEQGVTAATYFWPTSDANLFNTRPTFYEIYDGSHSNRQRLMQVVDWLKLPKDKRPQFITSYFSVVDSANHEHGIDSSEAKAAVAEVDQLIGEFLDVLDENDIQINLVIVSDHGMAPIKNKLLQSKVLPRILSKNSLVVNGQTQLYVYSNNKKILAESAKRINEKGQGRYHAYLPESYPKHWRFAPTTQAQADVLPNLIVNAAPGIIFIEKKYQTAATHGYDIADTAQMEAVFFASGPNVKPGKVEAFENIHVFNFIAELIGVKTPADKHAINEYIVD